MSMLQFMFSILTNWITNTYTESVTYQFADPKYFIKNSVLSICDAFRLPSQKAYFYDRYPEIVLPSSIFYTTFNDKQDPPQKTRSINI
ncbi:hypothetical protein [Mucilaginibacter sp. RCC_168]|uniref:hypothetical protein n=1 Tax=Mucilaginibacter sp. RCC_168 TaxID=3239221 RepID=UPI003525AB39